jgi:hypothetical protein
MPHDQGKKPANLLSLASTLVVLSWGEMKQDSSSVRTVIWFQCHNYEYKPKYEEVWYAVFSY